jgi:teichuronic acid biosynthesis glycosyltransferase TuaG
MTLSKPLVSVIIPVYNAEKYILDTVSSVLMQSYKNIELILVEHASTDSSLSLLIDNFSCLENVLIIKCEINAGGPAMPRNKGIEAAKGSYIAFLDADDIWLEDKLDVQMSQIIENDTNFSCTHAKLIDASGADIKPKMFPPALPRIKKQSYGVSHLVVKNTIITSTVIVKREFLADYRFDESSNVAFSEDYLLWLCLMNRDDCRFSHVQQDLIKYRILNNSASQSYGRIRMIIKSLFVISKFCLENKREDVFLSGAIIVVLKIINIKIFNAILKVRR